MRVQVVEGVLGVSDVLDSEPVELEELRESASDVVAVFYDEDSPRVRVRINQLE
jgi:hypothetical protein